MAMGAIGATGGSRRRGRRHRAGVMSEINVTPMVDVMLVLLVIFMIAAPLLTVTVPVDLPESKGRATQENKPPVTISVNSRGQIYLMDNEVKLEELAEKLTALVKPDPNERVFVRGDRTATYGTIMKINGIVSAAGYKVNLVAEEER